MSDTELKILPGPSGLGIRFDHYVARGVSHSLTATAQTTTWRTPSGALKSVTRPGTEKYALELSCSDQEPPDFGGIWPGLQVVVECAVELVQRGAPHDRPAVAGSTRTITLAEGGTVTVYRPQLTMLVTGWNNDFEEWSAGNSWSLSLEEV